jgi:hypothetical protein
MEQLPAPLSYEENAIPVGHFSTENIAYQNNPEYSNRFSINYNQISIPPPPGSTVSATPSARMKMYGTASGAQQTRHARRIYVGGIPPNYTDEDGLRNFVNIVVAQGLGEENDHSYVLSVYINHKKCFAFVELKSIELTSASLALDGIIFRNIVLRILRANEYKPELVPAHLNTTTYLDLSGFQFGTPNAPAHYNFADIEDMVPERSLDALIGHSSSLGSLERGCIVIAGFPFEDSTKRTATRGEGCAHAPKILRNYLRRYKYGSVDNPEFELDLARLKIQDVGDVLPGRTADEAKTNLTNSVSELLLRGCIPFIVGGSNDAAYCSAAGLLNISGSKVAAVMVSAQLDLKLLEDMRFCTLSSDTHLPACDGRFVHFAAQVIIALCTFLRSFSLQLTPLLMLARARNAVVERPSMSSIGKAASSGSARTCAARRKRRPRPISSTRCCSNSRRARTSRRWFLSPSR